MKRPLILLSLVAVLGLGALGLWGPPSLASEIDRDRLVKSAGAAGPIVIVGLMTLAVVASPIPSAPIAMASGAAYGHFWGSI